MKVYKNDSIDAAYNIALEDKIFEEFSGDDEFFMLWRNDRAVIVGANQVIENEVDLAFAKEFGISIVRRKTGGGAVYHDLGNVNYTYISKNVDEFGNFLVFAQPVIDFLQSKGVDARHIGKNDVGIFDGTIDRKISGTAQRVKGEYILHHGTLMFDVDIDILEKVLTPDPSKLTDKGIKSIRSRVCNIIDYLPMTREEFWQDICNHFGANRDISEYVR